VKSVLVVLAITLAGLVTGCGSGSTPSASGRIVSGAGSVELTGTDIEVVLPSGVFTFTVSEPSDTVPADESDDGREHQAPDGRSFIGISWRQTGDVPAFGVVLHGTDPLPATLSLSAAGREIDLPDLAQDAAHGQPRGLVYVPVPDDADPTLDVEYDGLVQQFDTTTGERSPGPADGFYDITTTRQPSCPTGGPGRGKPGFEYSVVCQVSAATAVPYVAGRGWADDGAAWLCFDLTLTPTTVRWSRTGESAGPRATYRVDRQDGTAESDGTRAVVLGERDMLGDAYTATYALPVSDPGPWTFDIVRTYVVTRTAGDDVRGSPPSERLTYRGTVQATG
jgi:hypothetical protein